MKKTLFKYWLANFSMGLLLYVIYRIIISESEPAGESEFKKFMFILEILVSLGFSLLYLAAVLVSSLTLLLNLFANIRNNFYASLLTFLGVPLVCIVYLSFVHLQIQNDSNSPLLTLLILSGVYFVGTGLQFLMFRKKVMRLEDLQKVS